MPPKGKLANPSNNPFLFVNEDFNTLFGVTRNADLGRTKQSHVQRQSFARRRGGVSRRSRNPPPATEKLSSSAGSFVPAPGSESSELTRSQSDLRFPKLTFSTHDTAWLPSIPDQNFLGQQQFASSFPSLDFAGSQALPSEWPSENAYTVPQLQRANSRQITARLADFAPEPGSPIGNELSVLSDDFFPSQPLTTMLPPDPFTDTKTALELWAPPLMRAFATTIAPELFHTDLKATSLQNMRHVEGLHADMQSCMCHPAEMYALLAATSYALLATAGRLDLPGVSGKDHQRVPLLFKSKALEALRLQLASGILSHGIVIAVHRMVCAALFSGNSVAAATHYQATLSMIESLGGLETFDDFQKERLVLHDLHYAFATLSLPRLRVTWDPGNIPEGIRFQLPQRSNGCGSRIRALVEKSDKNIHASVGQAIMDLMETQDVLAWLQSRPYQPVEYQWLMHRRLAIIYRLLKLNLALESEDETVVASRDMVRFAVVYFAMAAISLPLTQAIAVDQFISVASRRWGSGAAENAWSSSSDLLLWTVVMLNMCITSGRQSQTSVEAFDLVELTARLDEVVRSACEDLKVETEEQLMAVLKTFLFEDEFADERYKMFVESSLPPRRE